jgi:hypothetical protein
MKKENNNYIQALILNFIVLNILLSFWIYSCIESYYFDYLLFTENFQIIAISFPTWYALFKLVPFFEDKLKFLPKYSKKSIIIVSLFAIFFSFKYYSYTLKAINNCIVNSDLRASICTKIEHIGDSNESLRNLTYLEYSELKKYTTLPPIPKEADSISYYNFVYDEFLGDYLFGLKYVVPFEIKIDSSNYKKDSFSKKTSYKIKNNLKYVSYNEMKY